MKLQVIIDDGLLDMIKDVCQMYKFDRSEFVRQAIRESIWIHTPQELKDWAIKHQGEVKTTTEAHGKDLTKLRQLVKETEKKYSVNPVAGVVEYPAGGPKPTPTGWSTLWFEGKKHWVDGFGNDKGEVK